MRDASLGSTVDPRDAVAELYRQHRPTLVRLAVFLCGDRDAAEEVVQDAFIGLQRGWARLDDPGAAIGYLRASVVNGTRNLHRHLGVVRRHLRPIDTSSAPDADFALLLKEEYRELITAVRTLPPRQREVLVLRYWSDLSEAEIAMAMGISPGTVKSTASRALAALERRLKED